MSVGSFRQAEDSDQGAVGHEWLGGGGGAGKRAPTDAIQRKAEGTAPPPTPTLATPARDDTPAPTMGQSYVDSIVHGPVDPKKVAQEQIAHGVHDENTITNEVFWALRPAQRGDHLKAGSADAHEWLRLRDEIVRPALSGHETHHAAPRAPEVGGGELAKHADAVAPRNEPVGQSGDATIDALLGHVPPTGSTNKVEATWLIDALKTKLFDAFPSTRGQLAQLAKGETLLRTTERGSDAGAVKAGIAELERQKIHAQQIDSTHYDVDGGHLPILRAMVDLAAGRLREFVRGGMKDRRELFTFGDMVRADVDYAKDGKHTDHTSGNAIDLGIKNYTADDIVKVLSVLPPGKIKQVFPDGGAGPIGKHVHLALRDDGFYELGLSFAPGFFRLADSIFTQQKEEEKKAGGADAEVGKVTHAEGLQMWHPVWYRSTGVHKGGGTWEWSLPHKREVKGLARPHIESGAVKALLATLDSGSARDVSVHAAKEDGVDPHAGVEKH